MTMEIREKHTDYKNIIAITNRALCQRPFLEQVERTCQAHPAALVLREKDLPQEDYRKLAEQVSAVCRHYEVPCILHFYPEAAEALGIRKLHLPLWKLRELPRAEGKWDVLGCSIHSLEEAIEAESLGATYLFAGHIYTTDCKKGVPARGLDFLQEICRNVAIPVYAIGGIRPEKLQEVQSCGAAGACMMSKMMQL